MPSPPARWLCLLLLCALCATHAFAATVDEWKSRAIYQLLTDRFARSDNSTAPCADLSSYCGGSFQGIVNHLDYIQNLGYDAIWISPVPTNQPGSYHGYGAKDLYTINAHFGGAAGLRSLVDAAHARDMYVMVDVVANHMGIPQPNPHDYSELVPFNSPAHFHSCAGCPQVAGELCWIQDWTNQTQIEVCQLDGLPDLDQTVPFVSDHLLSWVSGLVKNYSIDGLRIDTVAEVHPDFWALFQEAAGVYAVGEVFDGRVEYVAPYQNVLDATLSYPLYFVMSQSVFGESRGDMRQLSTLSSAYAKAFKDPYALGTFVENHDHPRFLTVTPSLPLYRSAIAYVHWSAGIPISYYGAEQLFTGGNDPACRAPLWTSGFDESGEQYAWMQLVVSFRKYAQAWTHPVQERLVDEQVFTLSRGQVFVALTNSNSSKLERPIPASLSPFAPATRICNIFWPESDCFSTSETGQWTLYLDSGEQKVYAPATTVQRFVQERGEEMRWLRRHQRRRSQEAVAEA